MRPLAIFAALLAIVSASPIFAQIGTERPVSTPVYAPVTSVYGEAIASDGKQFMAVWTDERSWLVNTCCGVFASRIAADGTVLDPQGIGLGLGHGATAIAWNGASYVVALFFDDGVTAASLSPEGRIEIPPFTIAKYARISASQAIASNGSVTILTTDRAWFVLDARLQVLETHSLDGASVYRSGDGFTLIANSAVVRLDSSGHQLQTAAPAAVGSAISCHKEQCIQVYPDKQTKHLAVVSYDPVTQTTGKAVGLPIANGPFSLASTSDGYLLVTVDNSMLRFDAQGLPVGAAVPLCCPSAASVAAASDGVNVAVLRKVDSTLSVMMVTPTGNRESRSVARSATSQYWPAITSSGSNYLVAWWETDGFYFGRIGLDGTILDDRGKQLSHNDAADFLTETPTVPSVVFDGTSYIVATSMKHTEGWYVDRSKPTEPITISRIDPATGMVLNVHTACGTEMRLARNENTTVAVWLDCSGDLDMAYVDGTGALLPAPITLVLNPQVYYWHPFLASPRLAWNSSTWLVTWEGQQFVCGNCPSDYELFMNTLSGMLVSANLTPFSLAFSWPASGYPSSSRVASNGHDFLVLADGPGVRHLSASGIPLDTFKKVPFSWPRDMVWDGVNYSVAHLEFPFDRFLGSHLAITRFLFSGEVAGTAVINADPPGFDSYASLFSLGNGKVIAAYTRFAPEPLYGGVERVFFTLPDRTRGRAVRPVSP
jgi:hypothetical protein